MLRAVRQQTGEFARYTARRTAHFILSIPKNGFIHVQDTGCLDGTAQKAVPVVLRIQMSAKHHQI